VAGHHNSESAPATSTVHQLTDRQPTTVRQLVDASSSSPSVRHHSVRQQPPSSLTKFHARRLATVPDQRHHLYEDIVSGVDSVKDAVARSVYVSDLKYGSVAADSEANELKRDQAVHACDYHII